MNIYELEKNSTPAPWFVDDAQPSWPMQRDILVESSWYTTEQKNNAILSAHCRNNFMKALEALRRLADQEDDNYRLSGSKHPSNDGTWKLIEELEEVN